jgi:hypothetical protein
MNTPVIHKRFEIKKGRVRYIYEYFNQHYLHVHEKKKKSHIDYIIDLAVLKPESHYEMNIPWNWLILSAVTIGAIAGLATHLMFNLGSLYTVMIVSPILFLMLILVVLSMREFLMGYSRKRVFLSRFASYPIVQIPFDSGQKRTFYEFVALIEKQIEASRTQRRIPEQVLQAGEMKTLRRLAGKGVLTKNQYNTAKNRIFRKLDTLTV